MPINNLTMNKSETLLGFLFVINLILVGCNSDIDMDNSGLRIVFSNGTIINSSDLNYYDSSTCMLFLKEKLVLPYRLGEYPNIEFVDFSMYINNELIYEGMVYPDLVAAPCPCTYYIASVGLDTLQCEIIPIRHNAFSANTVDIRNDQRIINWLKNNNVLLNGISISVDTVYISPDNDKTVFCTITIRNHDDINYFILDPGKMGHEHFNFYSSGLYLRQVDAVSDYYHDYNEIDPGWYSIDMNDLSLLEGQSDVSFTIKNVYQSSLAEGVYKCSFMYGELNRTFNLDMPLEQPEGRIWVGDIILNFDHYLKPD